MFVYRKSFSIERRTVIAQSFISYFSSMSLKYYIKQLNANAAVQSTAPGANISADWPDRVSVSAFRRNPLSSACVSEHSAVLPSRDGD